MPFVVPLDLDKIEGKSDIQVLETWLGRPRYENIFKSQQDAAAFIVQRAKDKLAAAKKAEIKAQARLKKVLLKFSLDGEAS